MTPPQWKFLYGKLQGQERALLKQHSVIQLSTAFPFINPAEELRRITAKIRAIRYRIGTLELEARACGIDLTNGKFFDTLNVRERRRYQEFQTNANPF